ncbi:MAG: hypothetical protein U1F98_18075 [Verrucomicrobiota bacterium]
MTGNPDEMDWSATTWKGSRLQQHRTFHALPFSRKLELIEQMGEVAARFGTRPKSARPDTLREGPSSKPH